MALFRFDPPECRLTVQAFASGLLSFAGRSPTFTVRDVRGSVRFDRDDLADLAIALTARADSLELVGASSASDRAEIETRMRRDVLQTSAFPEVAYHSEHVSVTPISSGRYRLRIEGRLSLHGENRGHGLEAELQVLDDALRLLGESPLRTTDYRIVPVTALAGTIKLKDVLTVAFDLIGIREAP